MNEVIKFPQREVIFDYWPMWYHKVRNLRYLYPNYRLKRTTTRRTRLAFIYTRYTWQQCTPHGILLARQALEYSNIWKCEPRQVV